MKIEAGLLYTTDHDWVKVEGNKAYVGISAYAEHQLGSIVYVELPEVDSEVSQGESCGVVESVKAATDLHAAVSGTIVEANEEVEDDPTLLNQDPYANWIYAVEISDASELDGLMTAEKYEAFLGQEA
ncbi:MAG: glycine cleavage system protein GcvH [Clostridium sp.]|uniref:glycine cleavage system protein GcvH n=1 Tax=Clostridium sp. TaxID=1506 RepID=UPI002FCA84B3